MLQTQLAVSWNGYQNNVCKGLSFMQERGEFVDMTLAADGHYVKVHKMVLSLISPYIKDLITSADCSHPVIFLNNMSYLTLCSILEYIYTGEVVVQREGLKELIQAGKALHIKGLANMALNICNDETIPDQNEMFVEHLDTDILENSDMELKYNLDSSIKEDPISVTEVDEKFSNSNEETMCEDISVKLHENVQDKPVAVEPKEVKPVAVKQKMPVTGGLIKYTMSNQGGIQLILNRYIYNFRYISKKNTSRRRWRCINYPRKMKCPAYLTTHNDRVVERVCGHNHTYHDRSIMKKYRAGITFSTIREAELQMAITKKAKTTNADKKDSVKTVSVV